jgi:hypothetical protein
VSFGDLLGLIVGMGSLTGIVALITQAILRYQDRKLRGRGDPQVPEVRAALEDLRAQLVEQQDLRQRLVELEERMDFAERMLARARLERLAPGGEGDR